MRITLLTIGAGPAGAAGANKMATACKTEYCAYDHTGNISACSATPAPSGGRSAATIRLKR
jgi:hypothetical protein